MTRVVLVIEFVRDLPWSRTRWAVALAGAYRALGHEVTVIADGADDPDQLESLGVELRLRRTQRASEDTQPRQFVRFAERELASGRTRSDEDTVISLTWLVPADIWLPIEHTPGQRFRELVGEGSVVSLAFESVQQRWLPTALLAARRARRRGPTPMTIEQLGLAAADRVLAADEAIVVRGDLRASLGIDEDERILLASVVQKRPQRVADVLAWAARNEGRLLVLGSDWYSIRRAFERANMPDRLVPMGATREPSAAVAAADAVLVSGKFGTGRLAALAIAMGKPIERVRSSELAIDPNADVSIEAFAKRLIQKTAS